MENEQSLHPHQGLDYIIDIYGILFIVDAEKDQLREEDSPQNTISFKDMLYSDEGYSFRYDIETKKLSRFDGIRDPNIKSIILPNLTRMVPYALARKYGKSVEEIKTATDFEVMVDQKLYQQRKNGQLPTIKIADMEYYVDTIMNELRSVDDLNHAIKFDELRHVWEEDLYCGYYNLKKHEIQQIDRSKIDHVPADLVYLEIPDKTMLDPYAYAKLNGFNTKDFLRKHPLKEELKAKITPIEKSGLMTFIKANQRRKKAGKRTCNSKGKKI